MQTLDHDVLQATLDWLNAGARPWLCTIVAATGSSPRPVGSLAAFHADGSQAGSISGGCVEEDLAERLRASEGQRQSPWREEYGVSAEENERLGLPCGGRLTLLLQHLQPSDRDWIEQILRALDRRQCIERDLELASGDTGLRKVNHFTGLTVDETRLRQCFGPRLRMLLVGAGQLAQRLAELALAMDYEVLVTDPREDARAQWAGPAVPLYAGMPDDIVREHAADRHSVIITLTHDPRIDDMALAEALESDAWYVGALGSVRSTAKRRERLLSLGLTERQLARLHAPVGLPIRSKTPIEIAVAIMAELTQLRRTDSA